MAIFNFNQPNIGNPELVKALHAIKTELTVTRAALNALVTAYNASLAKLDADATVTDVNYASTNPGVAQAASEFVA